MEDEGLIMPLGLAVIDASRVHPDRNYRNNPVYMTSVTYPLGAFRGLGWITDNRMDSDSHGAPL
jgi:hypothetical protein